MLIDTHCHLYSEDFDTDLNAVINRAAHAGVGKIFLPAIDSTSHERLLALADKKLEIPTATLQILPMMGLHPCSVALNFEQELSLVENYLNTNTKFYAIGEIGLDYYWSIAFKEQQLIAFERQINWAIERKLPIVIHSRKSTHDCIKVLKKYAGKLSGIFHCFSGSLEEAKEIIGLDFYLGIGGVATYKNSGLKELLPQLGLPHLVLETDAPYLTPVPHRGKRNQPAYAQLICQSIADSMGKTYLEVETATTQNALNVFGIASN